MKDFKLILTPLRKGLPENRPAVIDLMVAIEAPDAPADLGQKRPPLNLALVIDRSGSMAGRPLHEAKRCAEHVVGSLTSSDRVSIIDYHDEPAVVVPSRPAGDAQSLRARIAAIEPAGSTNLHGGWLLGAEQISPHVAAGTVSRVMLLSDGLANQGLTDESEIMNQCEALAGAGVSTSTYGLGNRFNEDLMVGMAKVGRGNAYYGDRAEDLFDPIDEELQLLSALCARKLKVRFSSLNGTRVEVLNPLRQPEIGTVELPDLAYDSQAWVLLRLTVPAPGGNVGESRLCDLVEVSAQLEGLDGALIELATSRLTLPRMPRDEYKDLVEDQRVQSRVAEIEVARIEREARKAALAGDWVMVDALMEDAAAIGKDSQWAARTVRELSELVKVRDAARLSKEAFYSASRKSHRLSGKDGATAAMDLSARKYLREKTLQGRGES